MRSAPVAAVPRIAATAVSSIAAAALLSLAAPAIFAHDPISTKVTWEGEIKRLVEARCVSCHSAAGRAPMPLTTYEEARPWARAIREEVLTRRMPKWHVVRGYGDFINDPSLSPFEVALFAAWADGGAPKTLPIKAATSPAPPAVAVGTGPAGAGTTAVARESGGTRAVEVPCSAKSLPAGRLVGLAPALEEGADLRMILTGTDGSQEPLLWLRNFDPALANTYWLRKPRQITRGMRVEMHGQAPCSVTVLLAAKTGT
jgi:hypothetical protein